MKGENGGIFAPPPHRLIPWYNHAIDLGVNICRDVTDTYVVSFPQVLKSVVCPMYGCPARDHNLGKIRENFMHWHWKAEIAILQEGPTPIMWCEHCGIHVPEARLWRHNRTAR